MAQPTIDAISQEEIDAAIEKYVSWASEWESNLPAGVFFGVWANFQRQVPPR